MPDHDLRSAMLNRVHESELIQQYREKNNGGDLTLAQAREMRHMRLTPTRGL